MGSSTKASLNAPNSPAGSLSLPLHKFSNMTHGHQGGRTRTKWHWRPLIGTHVSQRTLTLTVLWVQEGSQRTSWSRVTPLGSLWKPGLSGFYLQAFTTGPRSPRPGLSHEGYIPQKVKAQIKPLCKVSTVPAEVLWDLSAVLAYVGHLEIKMEQKQCGQRKSPSCSQPCATDPMIASATWNALLTQGGPICGCFPDQVSFGTWLQGLCQQLPFLGTLSTMETNPRTREIGLKLAGFRCPKKKKPQRQSMLI